jgi:Short C-terminal domain
VASRVLGEQFPKADEVATSESGSTDQEHDALDQLRRLAELKTAGAITEDEFDRKKADLLART